MTVTPASIRNNNPGAIEGGPSAKKFGSTSYETLRWNYQGRPTTNRIATFPTKVHGAAAMFDLLYVKYTGSTVAAAITKWCGDYYSGSYTKVLEQKCGVKPDSLLTKKLVRDADTAILLAKGMAFQEAGRDYPMSDDEWKQAHAMAFDDGHLAPEPNADNDVPFPKLEARRRVAVQDALDGAGKATASIGVVTGLMAAVKQFAADILSLGPVVLAGLAGCAVLACLHFLPRRSS